MKSQAGPNLDQQIARLLFGSVVIIDTQTGEQYMMGKDHQRVPVPPFSTDMETAQELATLLADTGLNLNMKQSKQGDQVVWFACFSKEDGRRYVATMAASAAEAVCAAALAAHNGNNIYKGTKQA